MNKSTSGCINAVCYGKIQSAYGFKWAHVPPRDCPGEKWKPIVGHPTHQISNYGRMKSPRGNIHDFIHKSRKSPYPGLNILGKSYQIHILVGRHFIPNPDKKPLLNHIDGNKWNPFVGNLEWCTHSENVNHGYDTGLNTSANQVLVTNLVTKEKRKFRSMHRASTHFGHGKTWLRAMLLRAKRKYIIHRGYKIGIQ